ncbi:hypothetical protein FRC03_000996 [Tulasnella sp. 419]|nr:hypothetical protein FRC03_000996 [Tulasnella sp. 419]
MAHRPERSSSDLEKAPSAIHNEKHINDYALATKETALRVWSADSLFLFWCMFVAFLVSLNVNDPASRFPNVSFICFLSHLLVLLRKRI